MAYTRSWSEADPLGTVQATTIDDEIRNLKVDIRERMDTLLGAGKWAGDPVGAMAGVTLTVPASSGIPAGNGTNWVADQDSKVYPAAGSVTLNWTIPFSFAAGTVITKFEYRCLRLTTPAVINCTMYARHFDDTVDTIATLSAGAANASPQTVASGALNYTVAAGVGVYAYFTITADTAVGSAVLYLARTTYTLASVVG